MKINGFMVSVWEESLLNWLIVLNLFVQGHSIMGRPGLLCCALLPNATTSTRFPALCLMENIQRKISRHSRHGGKSKSAFILLHTTHCRPIGNWMGLFHRAHYIWKVWDLTYPILIDCHVWILRSPFNTLHLKLQCPAVQPALVIISNNGHNIIDFHQVIVGERFLKFWKMLLDGSPNNLINMLCIFHIIFQVKK